MADRGAVAGLRPRPGGHRHRRRPFPRPDHPDRPLKLFEAQGALTVAAAFEEASMSDKPRGRRRRILIVIGTRPEAIKMAPVVLAFRREPWVDVRIVATAPHRQMLEQVLFAFSSEAHTSALQPLKR